VNDFPDVDEIKLEGSDLLNAGDGEIQWQTYADKLLFSADGLRARLRIKELLSGRQKGHRREAPGRGASRDG